MRFRADSTKRCGGITKKVKRQWLEHYIIRYCHTATKKVILWPWKNERHSFIWGVDLATIGKSPTTGKARQSRSFGQIKKKGERSRRKQEIQTPKYTG